MAPLTFQRRCEFISLALHATRVKSLSRVVPIAWGAPWRGLVRARPLSYQRRHYLEQSRAAERAAEHHDRRQPTRIDRFGRRGVVGQQHSRDRGQVSDDAARVVRRDDHARCSVRRGLERSGDRRNHDDHEVRSLPERVGNVRALVVIRRHDQSDGHNGSRAVLGRRE